VLKAKRNALLAIRDFITRELRDECTDGIGFTSALVNTLDTVRELQADDLTYKGGLLQKDREILILEFILKHDQ